MQMKYLVVSTLQLLNIVLSLVNAVSRFKYSVFDWRKCDYGEDWFLMVANVPIEQCLLECRMRLACNAVKYLSTRHECRLLETDINMASVDNTRPCVFIRMADVVDVIPIPSICGSCSVDQVCDIQNNTCVVKDICDKHFHRIQQSCYRFFGDQKTFAQAQVYCTSLGAHLVHINTEAENQLMYENIINNFGNAHLTWIGITVGEAWNIWKFTQTGNQVTYLSWAQGEPNGWYNEEKCAVTGYIHVPTGWLDYPCSWTARVICEKRMQYVG